MSCFKMAGGGSIRWLLKSNVLMQSVAFCFQGLLINISNKHCSSKDIYYILPDNIFLKCVRARTVFFLMRIKLLP